MALINCSFYSQSLRQCTSVTVILPENAIGQIGMKNVAATGRHKTLYLLHGLSDDHSIWQRRTSIERYAAPLGVAVIMPNVHRSFYSDMVHGEAFETYISTELPARMRSFFHLSAARKDTYIAGLSMGGYGAFKIALNHPQNYCMAASLSGCLDLAIWQKTADPYLTKDFEYIFGEKLKIANTRHDLFASAKKLTAKNDLKNFPKLYQCCGDKDFLHSQNIRFRDFALQKQFPLTYQEDAGFDHSWEYWDFRIQTVLQWMFGRSKT